MKSITRICLIGFGEVGQVLAADLTTRGVRELSAWDIQFSDPGSSPARALGLSVVRAGENAADAIRDAQLVISAVTAAHAIEAAREAVDAIAHDAFFLDLNSVSPEVKRAASQLIDAGGARYVEAAIMSPISPGRVSSPILLGGPHAEAFLPLARELGFVGAQVFSDQPGRASAAKMCRSVMVKGMEALLTESLLSARRYGVEQTVLDSLHDLFPAKDWRSLSRYMISRSLIHGRRRAEEMREVVRTVGETGIDPWMSEACAARQDWAAGHRAAAEHESLEAMLDAILAAPRLRK